MSFLIILKTFSVYTEKYKTKQWIKYFKHQPKNIKVFDRSYGANTNKYVGVTIQNNFYISPIILSQYLIASTILEFKKTH